MIFTKKSQIYSCISICYYTVYNSRNLFHSSGPVRVSLYPRPLMVRLTSMGLNVKKLCNMHTYACTAEGKYVLYTTTTT